MNTLPLAFPPKEAARLLSVSRSTIYEMIRDGEITRIRVRGCPRIPRSEIERIIGAPLPNPGEVTAPGPDNLVWLR